MFQSPEDSLVAHKLPLLICSGATFFGSLNSGLPPALLCPRSLRYPLLAPQSFFLAWSLRGSWANHRSQSDSGQESGLGLCSPLHQGTG